MQQERTRRQLEHIRKGIRLTRKHDSAPSGWIEEIPKLSVPGETTVDDILWGTDREKWKEDLSGAGLTKDQVSKIETTLLGFDRNIHHFYWYGKVTVFTLRQLTENELEFILRSKTDASIVKKLF